MKFHKTGKKVLSISILSLLIVSSVNFLVYARKEKEPEYTTEREKGAWSQERQQLWQSSLALERVLELMDCEVKSIVTKGSGRMSEEASEETGWSEEEGDTLGDVEDIVFDDDNDVVHCVIVESDGTYYPVPWQAFDSKWMGTAKYKGERGEKMSRAEGTDQPYGAAESEKAKSRWGQHTTEKKEVRLCLNISKEQFRQAPSIESLDIEDLSDPSLKKRVCNFYSQHGMLRGEKGKEAMSGQGGQRSGQQYGQRSGKWSDEGYRQWAQQNLIKCSEVIDMEVEDYAGDEIAEIEDVVVDLHHGSLAYGLVDFGGFWGIAEETAAVPWSAFSISREEDVAMLDANQEMLSAAVLEDGKIDRLSDRQFARQIHDTFETEFYWVVLAFVPAETTTESFRAWQPESSYNQNFRENSVTTVKGSIRNVGSFRPQEGAARGLRLKVKPEEGKAVIVYAGPRQWTMGQDIKFKSGENITVKGSKTQVHGKTIIMASEITIDGKTLKLRDSQGKPQWKQEQPQY